MRHKQRDGITLSVLFSHRDFTKNDRDTGKTSKNYFTAIFLEGRMGISNSLHSLRI